MDNNNTEPSRFDLIELDTPSAPATARPAPAAPIAASAPEQRPSLPLSPAAQRLAERAAAPVTESYYDRGAVRREYRARVPQMAPVAAPAAPAAVPAAQAAAPARPALGREMVAGARREATASLISWRGEGSMTRGEIVECLRAANLPESWAPAPLSAHAVVGRRLAALNAQGRVVRAIRKGKSSRAAWKARWIVGAVGDSIETTDVDGNFGRVVLTVDLMPSYAECEVNLRISGDADLEAALRRDVAADLLAETLSSADVTAWLQRVIRTHLAGVEMGALFFVPSEEERAARAEALCVALRDAKWGRSWLLPAIPVATSEQLQHGLVEALKAELVTVYEEVMAQTGTRGLVRAQAQVEAVAERARVLGAHLGEAGVAAVMAGAKAMRDAIAAIQGDVSQRAAMLELA